MLSTQRVVVIAFALAVIEIAGLVAMLVWFVDRPLAEALRAQFAGNPVFVWMTYPAKPLASISALLLIGLAVRAGANAGLTRRENALLRGACAILIAWAFTYILKEVCGRTWPETWVDNNPSYFGTGTYGFFPFAGGIKYAAFPSGHMTVIAAFAGALWFKRFKWRWIGIVLSISVAIGLLGANYHWLSDIIAGTFIGAAVAFACTRLRFGITDPEMYPLQNTSAK